MAFGPLRRRMPSACCCRPGWNTDLQECHGVPCTSPALTLKNAGSPCCSLDWAIHLDERARRVVRPVHHYLGMTRKFIPRGGHTFSPFIVQCGAHQVRGCHEWRKRHWDCISIACGKQNAVTTHKNHFLNGLSCVFRLYYVQRRLYCNVVGSAHNTQTLQHPCSVKHCHAG